jgi:hypothetical protein
MDATMACESLVWSSATLPASFCIFKLTLVSTNLLVVAVLKSRTFRSRRKAKSHEHLRYAMDCRLHPYLLFTSVCTRRLHLLVPQFPGDEVHSCRVPAQGYFQGHARAR